MSEHIHCNDCGFVGVNADNGESAADLMDRYDLGELDWEEYQSLLAGSRFSCPSCGSLDTEVAS